MSMGIMEPNCHNKNKGSYLKRSINNIIEVTISAIKDFFMLYTNQNQLMIGKIIKYIHLEN
jgi:hypothetical protein